jgi:hypothetical protein
MSGLFFWFVHDCAFLQEDWHLINANHYHMAKFLQPIRNMLLAMDIPDPVERRRIQKQLGNRYFLLMATREFMKTGFVRVLPHWITTYRPKTTTRYARETVESAGKVLSVMKSYWSEWPPMNELWPWLQVTAERRKEESLKWSIYHANVPLKPGYEQRMDPTYAVHISNESTVEAYGVSQSSFTGSRFEMQIDDDVVGTGNAHTARGRDSVRRFRNESVNTLRAGGVKVLLGTIHDVRDHMAHELTIARSNEAKFDIIRPRLFYMPAYWDKPQADGSLKRFYAYPEILDQEELDRRKMIEGPREFAKQYLLQAVREQDAWFPYKRCQLWSQDIISKPEYAKTRVFSIFCDPALSKDKQSDPTAIVTLARDPLGNVETWRSQKGHWQQHEVEQRLYAEWLNCKENALCKDVQVWMETIAFIESYRQSMEENVQKYDPDFVIQPLKTNTRTQGKRARAQSIETLIFNRKWHFKAKPGVEIGKIDTANEAEMMDAIDEDQIELYLAIRDAHGFEDDGGLDNDHELDCAARIRQVMDIDSDYALSTPVPNAEVAQQARITDMINHALKKSAKKLEKGDYAFQRGPAHELVA